MSLCDQGWGWRFSHLRHPIYNQLHRVQRNAQCSWGKLHRADGKRDPLLGEYHAALNRLNFLDQAGVNVVVVPRASYRGYRALPREKSAKDGSDFLVVLI